MRRRPRRSQASEAIDADPPRRGRPSPERRAYLEAQRRVNAKISFYTHLIVYGSVLTLILVASRNLRSVVIVAAAWGIGLAVHYFAAVVAPQLRRRLIAEEVSPQVEQGVTRERRAIETRHVRSLEDLSASIAHEIRNPITAAKSLVAQMGEDPVSADNIDYAKVALEELDRVERSISHLLRFARDEELRFEEFEMADAVASSVDTFRDRIAHGGVDIQINMDTPGRLRGDAEKIRRVLINLVGNALDALEQGALPAPVLEVSAGENLAGDAVWVRIRDNGPGLDPEIREKIFSPFYTTKKSGTGLGLALSKKVVDAHGGSIEAQSEPGLGSEFVLTLPKQPRKAGGKR